LKVEKIVPARAAAGARPAAPKSTAAAAAKSCSGNPFCILDANKN
jgi:hypothetical protein